VSSSKKRKSSFSIKRLQALFNKYKDRTEQEFIDPEGVERFCRDLQIDPENKIVLVMAWHLDAKRMGYFSKDEFIQGFKKLGVDSLAGIQQQFPRFEEELQSVSSLKEIHKFAFFFAKEPSQRCLDLETAKQLLILLFGDRFYHTKDFVTFLGEQTNYRVMNFDQWMIFLEFVSSMDDQISNYDPNKAWPVMFDEYVEWRNSKFPSTTTLSS